MGFVLAGEKKGELYHHHHIIKLWSMYKCQYDGNYLTSFVGV
jgi:hypothetical protein